MPRSRAIDVRMALQSPSELASAENFSMKANAVTREVVAVMEVEEGVCLELSIKLPPSWPLVMAEVECRRQVNGCALPRAEGAGPVHARSMCLTVLVQIPALVSLTTQVSMNCRAP